MALAYALGWIRVSGGNSVLPIWVHSAMPAARSLIGELREQACDRPACRYCQQQHNPENLMFTHFQKASFRAAPAAADGTSLQRAIAVAGLARKSLLAVLPTGGGRSIILPISAGIFGVPLGFAVIIIVSLLTPAPKQEIQELVEHVRYPNLNTSRA